MATFNSCTGFSRKLGVRNNLRARQARKRLALRVAVTGIVAGLAAVPLTARAADGTWTSTASGSWGDTGNWLNGIIADGDGFAGNFNTLDLTGDITVSLDVARTLGALNFSDTAPTTAGRWILSDGGNVANTLTLTGNTQVSQGTVSLTGTLSTASLFVSAGGTGNPSPVFSVDGGTFTSTAASTINAGTAAGQFILNSGSAAFNAGVSTSNNDGAIIRVNGGTLTATDFRVQRNGGGAGSTGSFTSGLMFMGGTVNAGTIRLGTNNSNGAMTIEGANVAATGQVTLGNQTSSNRGGHMRILSGTFTVTDATNGLVFVQQNGTSTANQQSNASFTGGVSTIEKISFGFDANAIGTGRLNLNGGELYIGAGGIVRNSASVTPVITLSSGTLGAKDNWSGTDEVNMTLATGATVTIKAADAANAARDITIAGALSGSGTFTKTGGGTLLLTGANIWTGGATVSEGTLAGRAGSLRGNIINNATVGFNEATSSTFAGMISGTGAVTKTGPGTSTIANAQTYTGATTVNQGVLGLVGAQATSGVTVNNGGGISVAAGDATVNALTLGSAGGDAMTLVVNGGGGINTLTVSNTDGLVANGMTAIDVGAVGLAVGTHTIVDYAGTIGGNGFASFSLATLPPRVSANLANNAGNTSVDLNVISVDFPRWTGAVNGDWDINSTQNWKELTSGNVTTYLENTVPGDLVIFDDSATGTTTVNLTTTVQPSLVTFDNNTKTYTLTGVGTISGSTPLIKQGNGTTIISNTGHTYTGGTTIQGGTLQLAAANALPAGGVITASGGTLDLGGQTHDITGTLTLRGGTVSNGTINKTNSDIDLRSGTLSATLTGPTGITKSGTGTATVLGTSHTYAGPTVVEAGTLQFGDGTTNGSVPGAGAIQGDMPNITNAGTVIFNNGSDQVYTGSIIGTSGTVVKNGPGTLTLSGVNATSGNEGNAIVNQGTVVLIGTGATANPTHSRLGRGGTLTINNGGTVVTQLVNALGLNTSALPPNIVINPGGTLMGAAATGVDETAIYNITLAGGNWTGDPSHIWNLRGDVDVTAPASTITIPTLTMFNDPIFDVATGASLNVTGTLAGATGITKAGPGTMTLSGSNTYSGETAVEGGKLIFATSHTNSPSLTVINDAVAELSSDGSNNKVIRAATIGVSGTGRINLTDNKLITSAAAGTWTGTAYDGIAGLVDSGRGPAGNALWDGSGIVTSDTRAINNGDLVSIGVARTSEVRTVADTDTTTFAGQTVLGSDTLAMVTWGGDANLDGKINIDDYGRIDGNVGQSGSVFGWSKGDFNYDGKINIDDYGIIDGNINRQGAAFATAGGASSAALEGVAAVPEPAGLSLIAAGAMGLLRRRRRAQ